MSTSIQRKLLAVVLLTSVIGGCSASSICSDSSDSCKTSNCKTFLMPRDPATDLAMDFTTWHKMRNAHYKNKDHFGARFWATGYYKDSTNEGSLGKYFGCKTTSTSDCKRRNDFIGVDADDPDGIRLFPQDILHDAANAAEPNNPTLNPLADDIRFRPSADMWGLTLGYYQVLDELLDGLYLTVKFPIAFVSHDLNAKSVGPNTPQNTEGGTGSSVTVFDILSGRVSQVNNPNKQAALTHAKLRGCGCKDEDDDETALAGIRVGLGYNIFYEPHAHFALELDFLIPTGDSPDGKYLWEAVASNGDHWELGFMLDGHYEWKLDDDLYASINGAFNYMYVFEDTERRTLGFNRKNGVFVPWGHYLVGGQTGSNTLFPLANVLTQKVDVEPGSKIDTFLAGSITYCDWTFDLGYEFFWKDREDVSLKCSKKCGKGWEDDTYGVAQFSFDTANEFDATDPADAFAGIDVDTDNPAIQRCDLNTSVAETPGVTSHKIFGGIGYIFSEWDNPLMLGFGGHYEFAGDRGILETWALWLKIGFAV